MNILLTGATGFLGMALLSRLLKDKSIDCIGTARSYSQARPHDSRIQVLGDISDSLNWTDVVARRNVVIHTAARTHVSDNHQADSLRKFTQVNVAGTLTLAEQAAASGVKRFIFISSIGVNGNNNNNVPFTADDRPHPIGSYACSKYEAELGLIKLSQQTAMEVVILRPPLVYGPNAPGNFGRLVRLVEKGYPLPLGAICNMRSFIALDNLTDLIIKCIDHPAAANQVFLAADGKDLSTSDLIRGIAAAMGKPCKLLPMPESWLRAGASLLGKKEIADRLLSSLQVDISKTRDVLGWEPPISVEEGLKRCFVSEKNQ